MKNNIVLLILILLIFSVYLELMQYTKKFLLRNQFKQSWEGGLKMRLI